MVRMRTPVNMDMETMAKIHDHPSHSSLKAFDIAADISSEFISVRLP